MDTNFCVRLAFVAAAFSVLAVLPAAAEDCKDPVTAEGKPATLRDLGAYPNSLFAWRAAVKEKYGHEYNSWRYSKDRNVDCVEKAGQWTCTRTAKPCIDKLHQLTGAAKDAIAKKECKAEALSSYGAKRKERDKAEEQAVYGWEIDTRKKHGKEWAVWKNADGPDIDCHDVKGGIQCIAVGTACKPK
ncbi:MAG TPA: hypothetical protein VNX29_03490 [Kaistia sp.]|nr:hypothetical protein [Kaistia sp.]